MDDPGGFNRLSRTHGIGQVVAWTGLIIMLGGLAVFGFALLSMFGNIDPEHIPTGFPPAAIYGFGAGIVGAILYSLGLATAPPEGPSVSIGRIGHDIIDSPGVIAPQFGRDLIIDQRHIEAFNYLDRTVGNLPLNRRDRRDAQAAVNDVADAMNHGQSQEAADSLEDLTNILTDAGVLAKAGTEAARAIIGLAQVLGPAGLTVLRMFGLPV